ncbi:MAG: hypothetical protein A3G93_13725 [Nitrospinae bacterium RIFCSPLOWO2_12_FULL_45_22]|nr:MAG: hypothetical protein A3G93_13725 [Nitrospinae bacterium RIFCSPLOWO2_12_FULL_45_22]
MSISLSQIHSVLKTYNRQLKLEKTNNPTRKEDYSSEVIDNVTISSEAKKRQLIEQILSQAVERFTLKEQKPVFADELPQ